MYPRLPFECPLAFLSSAPRPNKNSHPTLPSRAPVPFPGYSLLTTHYPLTLLESALPQKPRVTPLQSADPKTKHLKSFRIRRSEKRGGEGCKLLTSFFRSQLSPSAEFRPSRPRYNHVPRPLRLPPLTVGAIILASTALRGCGLQSPVTNHQSPFFSGVADHGHAR